MKIGIALGGGGSRGFAHLGVLKALEEAGILPSVVSGSSAGSIVGAFIAAGFKPLEILELVKKNKFIDYASLSMPSAGLFTLSNFRKTMNRIMPAKTFSELKIPLYVAVSNLYTGRVEYLSDGNLITAVEASCSIPVIFSPVRLNGQLYVDGGVLDNIPYTPLIGKCDKIISVSVAASGEVKRVGNLKEASIRSFEIIANRDRESARKNTDMLIEPPGLSKFKMLDTRHADELYAIGYECCKNTDLRNITEPVRQKARAFFSR